MEIYLDNSATTRVTDSVRELVVQMMTKEYGNPSSSHQKGVEAERILKDSRQKIARFLKVKDENIFFTSGGTESNNWAIYGTASANKRSGKHLITTAVEHASVLMPMKHLEERGYRVTYLPVDAHGCIRLEDLEEALCEDTILVSIMYVNNEIGTIEPIQEAAELIHKKNPHTLFHVDAVQAYAKIPVYPKRLGVDLLSASAHKLHGPKGVGFLYIGDNVKIHPLLLGGGQQNGMRSGTENVPGIAGLCQASEDAFATLTEDHAHMLDLKKRMIEGLLALPGVVVHSPEGDKGAAHIVSAAFPGVRSEVLLHALEERGIYVSAGSACTSNKKNPVSEVLKAMNLKPELQESTLRFSFSRFTTMQEIDACLRSLDDLLPALKRYVRR